MQKNKEAIKKSAVALARRRGYLAVTRKMIAEASGVSEALITYYYGSVKNLPDLIMQWAVERGDEIVVAQGIACRNTTALKAPVSLKAQAYAELVAAGALA